MTEDELHRMPWTYGLMSEAELSAWLASRKDAGRAIDIATCEIAVWYAQDFDTYGVRDVPEELSSVGRCLFVRSPDSRGWIAEDDLPVEKYAAAEARPEGKERYLRLPFDRRDAGA